MHRTLLSILGVMLLLVAGSVFAQTDSGGSYQGTDPAATTTGSTAPQDTAGSPSGSTVPSPVPANGSAYDEAGTAAQPPSQTADPAGSGTATHDTLPRTASELPLLFAFGLIGAAALLAARLYRTRDAG